jgi:hypothetical protein
VLKLPQLRFNSEQVYEWVSDLSEYRLRDLFDAINNHERVTGSLTPVDVALRKALKNEIDRRYA